MILPKKTEQILMLLMISAIIAGFNIRLAAAPMIVSTGLATDTQRSLIMAEFFETHFNNIVRIGGDFDIVKSDSLMQQLKDSNLLEESALMRFMKTAGIDVVVRGSISDRGNSILINLYAVSYDVPFNGNIFARYRVVVPLKNVSYSSRELSYCMEEHTGRFMAALYSEYKYPVRVQIRNGALNYNDFKVKKNSYNLFRVLDNTGNIILYEKAGRLNVNRGKLALNNFTEDGNYFILRSFDGDSEFLREFYYGRKTEIVFRPPSLEETLITALATPVISVLSPVASPAAYYASSDFTGLGLWAVNNAPYIYIGAQGLINRPSVLRDEKKDISHFQKSSFYFGIYYFAAAGASMYADAAGSRAANSAAAYNPVDPYMGSEYTALYFSILGSGGGHFYKGYRSWGYLYFHLDNMLLFTSLYYLLDKETYNGSSYSESASEKKYGYIAAGAALLVRAFEIYHCNSLGFNIKNGKTVQSDFSIVPLVAEDPNGKLIAGFLVEKSL